MSTNSIVTFGQHALYLAMLVGAPLLVTALVVGLVIGIIQAATQVNEMTLAFIPKLLAMALVLALVGPWMLHIMVVFTRHLILSLPVMVGLFR